jgi:hypothetical protein
MQITQTEEIGADQDENHNGTTNTTKQKPFFPCVVSVVPLWFKAFPEDREAELPRSAISGLEFSLQAAALRAKSSGQAEA